MSEERNNKYRVSISDARAKLGSVVKLVEGEGNNNTVVLTRRDKDVAVVMGFLEYTKFMAECKKIAEIIKNPKIFVNLIQACEKVESTGLIELDDEDFETIEKIQEKKDAFCKAEKFLFEDIRVYDWFEGIVWNGEGLRVFVSFLDESCKYPIPDSVQVDGYEFEVSVRVSDGETIDDRSSIIQKMERLKYLRRVEEEDFQLAKRTLEKRLSKYKWFIGIERLIQTLVLIVSDKKQVEAEVGSPVTTVHIDVPSAFIGDTSGTESRNSFLIKVEER